MIASAVSGENYREVRYLADPGAVIEADIEPPPRRGGHVTHNEIADEDSARRLVIIASV